MVISNCAIIFLGLLLASILMQFVRAKKRKKLVQQVDQDLFSTEDQQLWNSLNSGINFMFKDFRKLQIVKRNVNLMPDNFVIALDRYKLFSRFEALVTVSMLLFGAFAYNFCK